MRWVPWSIGRPAQKGLDRRGGGSGTNNTCVRRPSKTLKKSTALVLGALSTLGSLDALPGQEARYPGTQENLDTPRHPKHPRLGGGEIFCKLIVILDQYDFARYLLRLVSVAYRVHALKKTF